MIDKVHLLWPEIILFLSTCIVMVVGLSPRLAVRRACGPVAAIALGIAGLAALGTPVADGLMPNLLPYAKGMIAIVGLLLVLLIAGTVDQREEREVASGVRKFNPLRTNRAEFYAFFLFSLTGLMLCASADDLIWLFLALELTSLPTYIMVTISTRRHESHEAGVKYFFLGALGAAMFLYGFTLLYGGTGATGFDDIAAELSNQVALTGHINPIAMAGLLLSIIGISFKIAAVPMHFYTPDVYQGATAPVSAFLAFVPKTAGFLAIILLTSTVGWTFGQEGSAQNSLPEIMRLMLWVMAALTMTIGNVLALLQTSVKRMLAYSSIAHSGYMLVGVIAGPGDSFATNGLAAVLFYLFAYGLTNTGVFAVLACLDKGKDAEGEPLEPQTIDDLRGMWRTHPALAVVMMICALSLLGMPPLLGFFGKIPLFTAGISAGEIPLVIVLGLNSAIAAWYYLRLAFIPVLEDSKAGDEPAEPTSIPSRPAAAMLSAAAVVVMIFAGDLFMKASLAAVDPKPREQTAQPESAQLTPPAETELHIEGS